METTLFGMRHALYFNGMPCRQFVCVCSSYKELRWPAGGQVSAITFPDKFGTDTLPFTLKGWRAWLDRAGSLNREPGIGCTDNRRHLLRLRYHAPTYSTAGRNCWKSKSLQISWRIQVRSSLKAAGYERHQPEASWKSLLQKISAKLAIISGIERLPSDLRRLCSHHF